MHIDRPTIGIIKPHAPKTPAEQVVKLYPGRRIQIICVDFQISVKNGAGLLARPPGGGVSIEKINYNIDGATGESRARFLKLVFR